VVILTDWKHFTECDLGELAAYMSDPVMIDLRNLYEEGAVRRNGFRHYVRVGRKPVSGAQRQLAVRLAQRQIGWMPSQSELLTPMASPAAAQRANAPAETEAAKSMTASEPR
jgi:UDPglucose 6-dehydrogenase